MRHRKDKLHCTGKYKKPQKNTGVQRSIRHCRKILHLFFGVVVYILFLTLFCVNINARVGTSMSTRYMGGTELPTIPYGGTQHYIYLGADMEMQITVQIWGSVENPGVYSVPKVTDIVGLLSFAGGVSKTGNTKRIKIVRTTPEPEVIYVDLNKYFSSSNPELIPLMRPGDTVIVSESAYHKVVPVLAQCVSVIYQVAITFLAISNIVK